MFRSQALHHTDCRRQEHSDHPHSRACSTIPHPRASSWTVRITQTLDDPKRVPESEAACLSRKSKGEALEGQGAARYPVSSRARITTEERDDVPKRS